MIKEIFNKLSSEQRKQLMTAFEGQFTQIVHLDGNRFIGVNIVPTGKHHIFEQSGVWYYGETA